MSVNDPVVLKGKRPGAGGSDTAELSVTLANDQITFGPNWFCEAGRRRFTIPAAKALLDRLALSAEFDAWYAGVDSQGQGFAAKVVGDRIYIDQEPRDDEVLSDAGTPAAPNFAWSQFERSVKARTKRTRPQAS